MKDLRYNESTGEFETIQTNSTYYYVEGMNHSLRWDELRSMTLPKGTRIRKMLNNTWYPIEQFDINGLIPTQDSFLKSNSSTSYMRFDDSTYFYIEGIPTPYKWYEIKSMHLPKGTKIRKMLDDEWMVLD